MAGVGPFSGLELGQMGLSGLVALLQASTQNQQATRTNEATTALVNDLLRQWGQSGQGIYNYMTGAQGDIQNAMQGLYGGATDYYKGMLGTTMYGAPLPWEQNRNPVGTGFPTAQAVPVNQLQQSLWDLVGNAAAGRVNLTGTAQFDPDWLDPTRRAAYDWWRTTQGPGSFAGGLSGVTEANAQSWLWNHYAAEAPDYARTWHETGIPPEVQEVADIAEAQITDPGSQMVNVPVLRTEEEAYRSGIETTPTTADLTWKQVPASEAQSYLDTYQGRLDKIAAQNQTAASEEAQGWLAGYKGRFDAAMAELDKLGGVGRRDIQNTYANQLGQIHQNLIDRGLLNSSVAGGAETLNATEQAQALARLDEALAQNRINVGSQLSGDYLTQLQNQLAGIGQFQTAAGENIINNAIANWQYNVPYAQNWMQNSLGLQQLLMPTGPNPINPWDAVQGVLQNIWGVWGSANAQALANSARRTATGQAVGSNYIPNLNDVAGLAAMGAMGAGSLFPSSQATMGTGAGSFTGSSPYTNPAVSNATAAGPQGLNMESYY